MAFRSSVSAGLLIAIFAINFVVQAQGQGYSFNDDDTVVVNSAAAPQGRADCGPEITPPMYPDYQLRGNSQQEQAPVADPYGSSQSQPRPQPQQQPQQQFQQPQQPAQQPQQQFRPTQRPQQPQNQPQGQSPYQYNPPQNNPYQNADPQNPPAFAYQNPIAVAPQQPGNLNDSPYYQNEQHLPQQRPQPQPQPQAVQNPTPNQIPQEPQQSNPQQQPSPYQGQGQPQPQIPSRATPPPRTGKSPQFPESNSPNGIELPADAYANRRPPNNYRQNDPAPEHEDATKLINELNDKIKQLEKTQETLNKNIDELTEKLAKRKQKVNTTATSLTENKPEQAVEAWKELEKTVESPQELQNVTNDIVSNACDKAAPPATMMDFVHQIPADSSIKDSAYDTLADKMGKSEELQQQMYWREMSPYCDQVAKDIGKASPTTDKMLQLQDQMRLQAAKPIKDCTDYIGQQLYQPAINSWTNITADIPEPQHMDQLNTNMEKVVTKAYAGNPENIPQVFYFILILPADQSQFKGVAYNCLMREMSANGHSYDPSAAAGGGQQQPQASQFIPNYYTVGETYGF